MANASPISVRLIAVVAGVIIAITTSLGFSALSFVVSIPLVLGAAIAGRFGLAGKVLMWIGAIPVTLYAAELAFLMVTEPFLPQYYDFMSLMMFALLVLSPLLVAACDVMLLVDAIRATRSSYEH